ncbi:hypothetical protein CR513_36563, partial [Mucuna pruriens]
MVTMFIDTLPSPYYDKVVENVASNFADLVVVGKFTQTNSTASFAKKTTLEKKKGETNAVLIEPTFPQTKINTSSYPTQTGSQLAVTRQYRTSHQANREQTRGLPPMPSQHSKPQEGADTNPHDLYQAFPLLLEQKLIEVVPLKPLEPLYPRSYDLNAKCDYHGGAIGHATERCWSLKHKVQDLLDDRLLGFEDKGPNSIPSATRMRGLRVPTGEGMENPKHTIDLANPVEEGSHLYQSDDVTIVAYIEGNGILRPKPLIIQYNSAPRPAPFIIQVATKPIYNNNTVPWRYSTEEPQEPQIKEETITPEITNIARIWGITRSGRIFFPEALRNKELALTKKEKTIESPKRTVTEEEAQEFLKVIWHNEYEMLDQLQKTPA